MLEAEPTRRGPAEGVEVGRAETFGENVIGAVRAYLRAGRDGLCFEAVRIKTANGHGLLRPRAAACFKGRRGIERRRLVETMAAVADTRRQHRVLRQPVRVDAWPVRAVVVVLGGQEV